MAGVTFREVLYDLKLKCVLVWYEIRKLEIGKSKMACQCVLRTGKVSKNFFFHFLSCVCLHVCVCVHAHTC